MATVVTVTQYQAEDGSLFLSAAEADAHDFKLKNGAIIDAAAEAFLNTTNAIDRSRNMQKNTISAFLSFYLPWVEAGSPVVERTVFDTPKAEAVVVEGAEETAKEAVEGDAVEGDEAGKVQF